MEQKDYRLAAIMYTDIVGFSRMMEKDEAGTLKLLSYHNQMVHESTDKCHGSVIKTIGDAFLVVFRNTVEALQCAMEIQDKLYEHNKEHLDQPLLLRIGVHLGDIYFYENDALGEGINIAARLQSFARPGTICFSQDVYNQVLNKLDFRADKLGKLSLKNIGKEIHGYEIVSANTQFDPDKDKPRPGYKTDGDALVPLSPAAPDRSYSAEASATLLKSIKQTILEDTRNLGRRMTVDEANKRYGHHGVEAKEVIASLVEKGIIVQLNAQEASLGQVPGGRTDLASDIGKAVEGIARAIETKVNQWQSSQHQNSRTNQKTTGERVEQHLEQAVNRTVSHTFNTAALGPGTSSIEINLGSNGRPTVRVNSNGSGNGQSLRARHRQQDAESATGKWDKKLKDSEYFKPGAEDLADDFDRYQEQLEDKANRATGGFIGNLISYLSVNAFLWFINMRLVPGFNFAAIVSAAWGTGLVSNLFAAARAKRKAAEIAQMPELTGTTLDDYKKLNRVRDSMASHTASTLTVPAMLFVINMITSPGFWWSLIPGGIMILSYLGHLASYPGTRHGLMKKILAKFSVNSWRELFKLKRVSRQNRQQAGQYADFYEEAVRAKDEICRIIKSDRGEILDQSMIPTLNQYVEQVKMLTHSVNEIDQIVSTIPLAELEKDRVDLAKRLETASPGLQVEYRKSIAEIERQELACHELVDQKEVLTLRMRSSVNALKQLKIDMARLKTIPESANPATGQLLRDKANELTRYLEDLKVGYIQASEDPFAELERLSQEPARLPPASSLPGAATLRPAPGAPASTPTTLSAPPGLSATDKPNAAASDGTATIPPPEK
ncbi:MAG: hypothetical protein A2087_04480 [Spirochaetes bacterium GWD1_61_31]|nr:MAG: hypothetical protein A2Y37_06365 [Spirochaetes bacterium GWB1_60_80]OHD33445.1 MAG: hypothetical protein A2004_06170 [Spirochaetes bacterium GWC1_61_12]OHD40575.1 MAG: hypothetical protein A2087_04480 [Spirochaetes bacterium GWD1_61_31]OHD59295.1 MAG: hypothetical protein A2Y32_09855 [Spirochaetes bacterium GWF1_60_12]HAP44590.1 hypothetical protein [Spirochaetaceae bacterium]